MKCPACDSASLVELVDLSLAVGNGVLQSRIMECRSCTHRFLPTTEYQQHLIETGYDADYAGFRHDPVFGRRIRAAIAADIRTRLSLPASVLDVGCGNGDFIRAAREYGFETQGIDVSEAAVRFCTETGLAARFGDFLKLEFDTRFDAITMWDVVEHLRQPGAFLIRAKELLKPGGYLFLKIPGFARLNFYPIRFWNHLARTLLGAPGHVQYFTPKSLSALLHNCGFADIQWLPGGPFRSVAPTRSLKRKLSRVFGRLVYIAAGNDNLYLAVRTCNPKRHNIKA